MLIKHARNNGVIWFVNKRLVIIGPGFRINMINKYQVEIDEFKERFSKYKDKKIVLYGIGRYTVTLLEGVDDFCFIGLLDKDPGNIGKKICGIPVISTEEAERNGDIIIINTSETYWDLIFKRIKHLRIPVFYKDGRRAEKKKEEEGYNPYFNLSKKDYISAIDEADIVSFDFFDTLFMRSVCNPRDIFSILEIEFKNRWKCEKSYTEVRNIAKGNLQENYSFDELYTEITRIAGISKDFSDIIQKRELELEKIFLVPRKDVIDCLKYALSVRKKVYIISDMYLPISFYRQIMSENGIEIDDDSILISCELRYDKKSGTMWRYFSSLLKGKKAIHMGDDNSSDIDMPQKYGIKAKLIPSAWNMLETSSIKEIIPNITDLFSSIIMGSVMTVLFNSPFSLTHIKGRIEIADEYDMGYCVFGPVILTFLLWLLREGKADAVDRFIFMSRDGYLLQENFNLLCDSFGETHSNSYIGISRQLAMTASIETDEDLKSFLSMPYSGSVSEMFEDRLDIKGLEDEKCKEIDYYIEKYGKKIINRVEGIKKRYLKYIKCQKMDNKCGIVDLGFYGNNQRYLNKLLGTKMPGYYFNANLSSKNENTKYQPMKACFQKKEDRSAKNSQIMKRMIYLESFLTAPYGMVKDISTNGEFITASARENQRHFKNKEKINGGVKKLISDYVYKKDGTDVEINIGFIDKYYGVCFGGNIDYSDRIKSSFYNDNAMMNRIESSLFE